MALHLKNEKLNERSRHCCSMNLRKAATQPGLATLREAKPLVYFDRKMIYGELSAMRWLQAQMAAGTTTIQGQCHLWRSA